MEGLRASTSYAVGVARRQDSRNPFVARVGRFLFEDACAREVPHADRDFTAADRLGERADRSACFGLVLSARAPTSTAVLCELASENCHGVALVALDEGAGFLGLGASRGGILRQGKNGGGDFLLVRIHVHVEQPVA